MVTEMSLCGRGKEFTEHIYWVRHINWSNFNIRRAGVIPYTVINGHIHICLGVDSKSNELTDFGGGIRDSDINPLYGAIREFREESNDVFGEENYNPENYLDSPCLIKNMSQKSSFHMMIIFQEVDASLMSTTMNKFSVDFATNDEIRAICWCNDGLLKQLVYTPDCSRMYTKVKKFICNCISFNRLIYFLKLRSRLARINPYFSSTLNFNKLESEIQHSFIEEPLSIFKRKKNNYRKRQLTIKGEYKRDYVLEEEELFKN